MRFPAAALPWFGIATLLLGGCAIVGGSGRSAAGDGAVIQSADMAPDAPNPRLATSDPARRDGSDGPGTETSAEPRYKQKLATDRLRSWPGPSPKTDKSIGDQLAMASLDDAQLGNVRGGIDTGSGVELSFAFQQATFVNDNLVQSVVVPTLTVTPNGVGGGSPGSTMSPTGNVIGPSASAAAVDGLGMATTRPGTNAAASIALVPNGTAIQVNPSSSAIQQLLGSGAPSVVTVLGAGGLTNVINNAANNQSIRQVTAITIGINGLQQLLQRGAPSSVMSQFNSVNSALR